MKNGKALFALMTFAVMLFPTAKAQCAASDAFQACDSGDTAALKKLLLNAKSVDVRGPDAETPLIRCASAGQLAGVRFLIARKANVNAVNGEGKTALFYAVSASQDKVAEYLIKHGADLGGLTGTKKENLLFEAVRSGDLKILSEILRARPKLVNGLNIDGESALFEAVRSEQSGLAEILIKNGADRNLKNKRGQRAIDLADPKTDSKIIKVLSPSVGVSGLKGRPDIHKAMLVLLKCDPSGLLPAKILSGLSAFSLAAAIGTDQSMTADAEKFISTLASVRNCQDGQEVLKFFAAISKKHGVTDVEARYKTPKGKAELKKLAREVKQEILKNKI